jgi:hypothetical protein
MDVDATLAELRELIACRRDDPDGHYWEASSTDRLIELVDALDQWLCKGGYHPKDCRDRSYLYPQSSGAAGHPA